MSSDEMRTRPMIEALMERLDAFAQRTDANFEHVNGEVQRLSGEVQNLTGRVERLEGEMHQVKTELSELSDRVLFGFRKLDGKMELSDAWLEVRADMRDLNRRVDKIQPEHM